MTANECTVNEKIFRNASKSRSFTQIANDLLQSDMALDTIGFLCKILSLPKNWTYYSSWARRHLGVGEHVLKRIIDEAREKGFILREKERREDGKLTGKVIYYFTDVPWEFSGVSPDILEKSKPKKSPPHTKETIKDTKKRHYVVDEIQTDLLDAIDEAGISTSNGSEPKNGLGSGEHLDSALQQKQSESPPDRVQKAQEPAKPVPVPNPRKANEEAVTEAMRLYNATAERIGLARARILSPSRKRSIALRLKEIGGIDGWRDALTKLEGSDFCKGKNDRNWKASLDFLLQPSKLIKLIEGGYDFKVAPKPEKKSEFRKFMDSL